MLFNCGDVNEGARVLFVCEAAGLTYYDDDLGPALRDACTELGLHAELTIAPYEPEAVALPDALVEEMSQFDMTVFLARIGDQVRFIELPPGARAIVSYALDRRSMASTYATAPYPLFVELKNLIEAALANAKVEITCANGTAVHGLADAGPASGGEVTIRRFPLLVPRPVLAAQFSGQVALCGFLVGTGNSYYDPYGVSLAEPMLASFENGKLVEFLGSTEDVVVANEHYDRISQHFDVERNFVHSWHAGMHPACAYHGQAADNYEAWSGSAFGNPRLLHFHTCGARPPGEISWNIVDPTINIDGNTIWKNGRLHPERVPGAHALLSREPEFAALFDAPVRAIGI